MISKQQFIDSLVHETNVIKHLFGKLSPEHFEYRPAEKMRSTRELLQYLSVCALAPVKSLLENNWSIARSSAQQANQLSMNDWVEAMDRQIQEVRDLLQPLKEEDFLRQEVKLPWGQETKLGIALVNTSLKFLTAYKLQLFVYAKSVGLSSLTTPNCWLGVDQVPG
jgi:hypothetical protein